MPERTEDAGTARGCGDGAAGAVPQCGAAAPGTAAPLTCEAARTGAQETGTGGEQEPEEAAGAHAERPERPRRRRSRCCSRSAERGRRLRPRGGGEAGPGRAEPGAAQSPDHPRRTHRRAPGGCSAREPDFSAPGHGEQPAAAGCTGTRLLRVGYRGTVRLCSSSPGTPGRFRGGAWSPPHPEPPVPAPLQPPCSEARSAARSPPAADVVWRRFVIKPWIKACRSRGRCSLQWCRRRDLVCICSQPPPDAHRGVGGGVGACMPYIHLQPCRAPCPLAPQEE